MIILSRLSDALKLSGSDRFEEKQRKGKPTNTGLKLLSDPTKEKVADCVDNTHTDSGTLTVVFSDEWSTQIEHPETKVWAFCEPKKGLPLINVADSLQAHSGGKLHSCRHRVTQPVDGVKKRYFVAYFMRPEIAT